MSKTRGKILRESKHANNATCYAHFLAGHGLERCQGSLGGRISSEPNVCRLHLPHIKPPAATAFVAKRFADTLAAADLARCPCYVVKNLLITPPRVFCCTNEPANWYSSR